MKIGLFGGTFDPIHKGHTVLAQELIKENILDKVIFVVTFVPPHKDGVTACDFHRYNMVKIATNGEFEVSDYEIKKGGKTTLFLTYFVE